ncbi:hypothetical protein E1B28_013853 [Marasmius oreades]|uniref:Uncharacterized protein n=1 Tax=Marasmius oreades TaxID=181124 RepID=A0A9P7RLE0_9AGAR|nr:uncharacterized protein E1B28_013853 [Marasmius oreades]KAG7085313.1 hypothetical protein E1B28_013853 [Marasmius oreades]
MEFVEQNFVTAKRKLNVEPETRAKRTKTGTPNDDEENSVLEVLGPETGAKGTGQASNAAASLEEIRAPPTEITRPLGDGAPTNQETDAALAQFPAHVVLRQLKRELEDVTTDIRFRRVMPAEGRICTIGLHGNLGHSWRGLVYLIESVV